jgi:hypothetical protein
MSWLFHLILLGLGELLDWLLLLAGAALIVIGATSKLWAAWVPALMFFRGPVAVAARWLGVALCIYGGGSLWLVQHDAAIVAEWKAAQVAAVDAAREQEHQAAVAALEAAQRDAAARVRTVTVIKREIANAPVQTACVDSPAIAAALDGLHRARGGTGTAAGGAPVAAGVRTGAGPPGATQH